MPTRFPLAIRHTLIGLVSAITAMAIGGCTNTGSGLGTAPDPRAEGEMVFYRLDGDHYPGDPTPPGAKLLHGHLVLKACPIDERDTRETILNAFDAGIADHRGGVPVDCFRPRHAIRIVRNGVTTDHLICFQCSNWMTWTDGEQTGGGDTSDRPRETFDRILDDCATSS
jgi:hypothetical protein